MHALVARSRTGMLIGWVLSALGEQLVHGSSHGLVALDLLPAIWVAAYSTVGTVEDLMAPLIVRPLSRFRPGLVLAACELLDALLLVAALTARGVGVPTPWVLVIYLLLTSPIPLVLDVTEEFYGEEMARFDPEVSYRFTMHLHSLSAFVSRVVAVPAGAWLTAVSVEILLTVNLLLTLVALALRWRAARAELALLRSGDDDGGAVPDAAPDGPAGGAVRLRDLLADPLISPVPVLLRSIAAGVAGTYVLLAAARTWGYGDYILALVVSGLGATAGPQLMRRLRRRLAGPRALGLVASATTASCLGALIAFRTGAMWPALLMLTIMHAGVWAVGSGLIAERQVRVHGEAFIRATTWAQAAGAGGSLIGVWAALWAGGERAPVALLAAAGVGWAVIALLMVAPSRRGARTDRSTVPGSRL